MHMHTHTYVIQYNSVHHTRNMFLVGMRPNLASSKSHAYMHTYRHRYKLEEVPCTVSMHSDLAIFHIAYTYIHTHAHILTFRLEEVPCTVGMHPNLAVFDVTYNNIKNLSKQVINTGTYAYVCM